MAEFTEVTDTTFAEVVYRAPTPVLLEFWAPWAKACKLAEPLLAAAAAEMPEGVRLVRCNVEQSPMAATVYGVRKIPLVILFRQGEELDSWSGPLATAEVADRLRAACGGPARDADSKK